MGYIQGNNREQQDLFPPTIDEMVLADSPVRLFDTFVESLNLVKLGFEKSVPSTEGRPAYNPADLLKLYLYGYFYGIRSSRKLARECYVNIEVMWLINQLKPDFRTISDFRKDNKESFPKVFKEFNRYCWQVGILGQSCISIDGSKFKAVNSLERNFTQIRLDASIDRLGRCIQHYLDDLESSDCSEDKIEEINNEINKCKEKISLYQNYQNRIINEGKTQISLTDPESKLMKTKDGFVVCYNNQAAVDAKSHLIAGFDVTDKTCDFGLITSLADSVKEDLKSFGETKNIISTLADRGYQDPVDMMNALEKGIIPNVIQKRGKNEVLLETTFEESEISDEIENSEKPEDIKRCLRAGVIPNAYKNVISRIDIKNRNVREVKKTNDSEIIKMTNDEMIAKAKSGFFIRNPEANIVYCPQGKILHQETIKKNGAISYRNRHACEKCTNKCSNVIHKYVCFTKDETIKEVKNSCRQASYSMGSKRKKNSKKSSKKIAIIHFIPDQKLLVQRQNLSEHPFGTVKRNLNSYYLLLKGKNKVKAEMALIFLAYNMRRAINIAGIGKMMGIMK